MWSAWGRQLWRQAGFPQGRLERAAAAKIGGPTVDLQKPRNRSNAQCDENLRDLHYITLFESGMQDKVSPVQLRGFGGQAVSDGKEG